MQHPAAFGIPPEENITPMFWAHRTDHPGRSSMWGIPPPPASKLAVLSLARLAS
jgi:hypothetical protein